MVVDVSELEAYAARLTEAAATLKARASAAVRRTAYAVEADAKALAPVDTGNLRNSITTSVTLAGTAITAEVGPTAEYGGYVEYGTSTQGPQPFLGPAFDRRAPQLEAALVAAATEGL